ncbi:MAG: site-2 protease family protein [Verrucomicrobiota bacterium JB022]|nr:site-2 protease family protein [Verrucomicrobiota bacterium JB022]
MPPEVANAVLLFIVLLISIALHEYGHAKVADLMGNYLPRQQGRVTLNPMAHLDPIGSFVIPGINIFAQIMSPGAPVMLGWGKPVVYDGRAFDRLPNPVRRELLTVAAGPGMNLVQAFVGALILAGAAFWAPLADLGIMVIQVNCALFVFNLMPIPPLDGSHFVRHIFGISRETMAQMAMPGLILLIVLINIPQGQMLYTRPIIMLMQPFVWLGGTLYTLFLP